MPQTYPKPFNLIKSFTQAVNNSAAALDLRNHTAYLMNSGTGKVFINGNGQAATANDWCLASGEKSAFPLTGLLSVISDTTATLNILYVDVDFVE